MIPFDRINEHYDHTIEIARYTHPNGNVANVSVECMECCEVIVDTDAPWMEAAKDAVYGEDNTERRDRARW